LEVLNISTRALQNSLKVEHLKFYLNKEDMNIQRNNLNNKLPDGVINFFFFFFFFFFFIQKILYINLIIIKNLQVL